MGSCSSILLRRTVGVGEEGQGTVFLRVEDVETSSADKTKNEVDVLREYLSSQKEPFWISTAAFGSPGIGKRCFAKRMGEGIYVPGIDPFESYTYSRTAKVLDRFCVLRLDPCIGDPTSAAMIGFVLNENFVFVMYNVSDRKSFEDMQRIYRESVLLRQRLRKSSPWYGGFVVALASDLGERPDAVRRQEGVDFAESNGLDFHATSAKTGLGCTIADASAIIMSLLLQQQKNMSIAQP